MDRNEDRREVNILIGRIDWVLIAGGVRTSYAHGAALI